jgi:hypothetical protein
MKVLVFLSPTERHVTRSAFCPGSLNAKARQPFNSNRACRVTDWGPTPGITKKLFRNLWSYDDVVDVTVLQWEAERMSSFDLAVFDSQVDLEMVDRVARWMGSLGPPCGFKDWWTDPRTGL